MTVLLGDTFFWGSNPSSHGYEYTIDILLEDVFDTFSLKDIQHLVEKETVCDRQIVHRKVFPDGSFETRADWYIGGGPHDWDKIMVDIDNVLKSVLNGLRELKE